MPISDFISTGLYFSGLLFVFSAFLLTALYRYRWRSSWISLVVWIVAYACAALITWQIIDAPLSILSAIAINLLFCLLAWPALSKLSLFGLCLWASIITPVLYTLIWGGQLMLAASRYYEAGWALTSTFVFIQLLFSLLLIYNMGMGSWVAINRLALLYLPFSRLNGGWRQAAASSSSPLVSIHIPCYNEPPEIVIQTLDSLASQHYSNFEVILLDNNTEDPAIWKPIEAHCQRLGARFRFYHLDKVSGAKAGALNVCLKKTTTEAELVCVMDADYVAQPEFLKKLIGFFDDPQLGFVQACQDYRAWENNSYLTACYYEYASHFRLVLPGLSEWDASYTIGTMCLFRRKVLDQVGGWAEWCLTEDSEVAVRIHASGYTGYYLKDTFGRGLIPETFENYKRQRFRWSVGPSQQIQRHWRLYLPFGAQGQLTLAQKLGEINHSLAFFFGDFLNLIFKVPTLAFCVWFYLSKQGIFTLPAPVLALLIAGTFRTIIFNQIAIGLVGGGWKDYLLSTVAIRSLIYTRNLAFIKAWTAKNLQWHRTDKFKAHKEMRRVFTTAKPEITSALVYLGAALLLTPLVDLWNPDLILLIWIGFVNQAASYLCAPLMAFLSERNIS